jgi:hypothetical protein
MKNRHCSHCVISMVKLKAPKGRENSTMYGRSVLIPVETFYKPLANVD